MCGGGVGSANDSSNDDEQGSGNSFQETMANIFTPGDGMSYVDGVLTEDRSATDPSRAKFYDYSAGNDTADGPGYANIMVGGEPRKIRRDANDSYKQNYASALLGAATGGLPGLIGSIVTNKITGGAQGQALLNTVDTAGNAVSGIKGLFAEPEFANAEEEAAYREKQKARLDAMMASASSNKSDDDAPAQTVSLAPTPAPTTGLPAASDMSQAAAQGAFQSIPNPDYDPSDPLSPRFLLNPTYEQLLAYQQSQSVAMGMAEGGEVGGNEKTMIADAVSAVKGEMSQEESAVVLGQFLAAYGEDALRDLVDKVQSGELDDTVDRFANGEAGEVNGPGDGSGVDDKVPASLEGQQDVLLADGEFVLRKKTADALEKKYGGGFLDAVNEAENDAPRTMREYMAKTA
jgi:hypothetical protein